ncbi:hypothetical protein [Streptomyces sp. IBSBF 3136]|uniref:hypothetical protein n=1 Tax=Streptomyces sp. IBSBF 3136 TaxID=2903524 RepID=UPI002FDC35AD
MARSPRSRRFVMLAASSVLAAGGALIPTGAFAAPQHVGTIVSMAPQGGHGSWNHGGGHGGHGHGNHDGGGHGGRGGGKVVVIINNTNTNTNTQGNNSGNGSGNGNGNPNGSGNGTGNGNGNTGIAGPNAAS